MVAPTVSLIWEMRMLSTCPPILAMSTVRYTPTTTVSSRATARRKVYLAILVRGAGTAILGHARGHFTESRSVLTMLYSCCNPFLSLRAYGHEGELSERGNAHHTGHHHHLKAA